MQQKLLLNIIPITPHVDEVTFPFYREYQEGFCPIYIDDEFRPIAETKLQKLATYDNPWLYTDFREPTADDELVFTINLSDQPDFAEHYYRFLIFRHFKSGLVPIMHRNYIREIEIWTESTDPKNANISKFKVYMDIPVATVPVIPVMLCHLFR